MYLPVADVHASPAVLFLVPFFIALLTTPAGVSGAFLLLPFQVSVLGFVTPAVTPTNLVFNVASVPGGILRYWRDGITDGRLVLTVVSGTVPGVAIGTAIRVELLAAPGPFKLFVGTVLLVLSLRLLVTGPARGEEAEKVEAPRPRIVGLAFVIGIVGGIYGISGGSMLAPSLVAMFGLSVRRVAAAALTSTFVTSLAGVVAFEVLGVRPDYVLGLLLASGGIAGSYLGARLQGRFSPELLRRLLGALAIALAVSYIAPSLA